jgi:hypothetical protein
VKPDTATYDWPSKHGVPLGSGSFPLRNAYKPSMQLDPRGRRLDHHLKRPATQWVKPGIFGRVRHLHGQEDCLHASPQDFREK